MDKKEIADAIEEMVDKMVESGGKPYAIICSKETFKKLGLYFRTLSPIEEKFAPRQIWFKYDFGDLPLLKFKYCPEDKVHVVDKDTYEQIMRVKDDNVFPDEIMMEKILKTYEKLKKAKIL